MPILSNDSNLFDMYNYINMLCCRCVLVLGDVVVFLCYNFVIIFILLSKNV